MTTPRQTNNSMSAGLFGDSSLDPESSDVDSSSTSATIDSVVPVLPPVSTPVAGSSVSASVAPDPAFLAAVVNAVKVALAAEQAAVSTSIAGPASSSPMPVSVPGGVPSQDLGARTETFLASGTGFPSSPPNTLPSFSQGRPNYVVPSFISTFAAPRPAIPMNSLISVGSSLPYSTHVGVNTSLSSLPSAATLQQPFVVGPGFSPIPAKTVSQILAGKYVDPCDLLSANIVHTEPESTVLLDGRLVFAPSTKKNRRRIEDIGTWSEAFTIFSMILTSHFPYRWRDLMSYKLLILRTHRQYTGRVWLAYDKAFREHAAATKLVDWSSLNVQLYSLSTARASVRGGPDGLFSDLPEPFAATSSQIICRSWNRGRCSAQSVSCRFAHRCSNCGGPHRAHGCSIRTETSTRQPAPAGRLRLQFRPPVPNPGAVDGCSRVLTVNVYCLPTVRDRLLS